MWYVISSDEDGFHLFATDKKGTDREVAIVLAEVDEPRAALAAAMCKDLGELSSREAFVASVILGADLR